MSFDDLPLFKPSKWGRGYPYRAQEKASSVARYWKNRGHKIKVVKQTRWVVYLQNPEYDIQMKEVAEVKARRAERDRIRSQETSR